MEYPHLEPEAKAGIDRAREEKIDYFVFMPVGFKTDEEALILKDLIWYAYNNGVTIMIPGKDSN